MRGFIKGIKTWFAIRNANKELTEAILVADEMYKASNKRFYVIADSHNKLRVFSWSQLKQMKKQGLFSSAVKEPDFIRESFYYTPSGMDQMYMKPETKEKKRKMCLIAPACQNRC